jgi:hypothetical protein
LLLFCYFFLCFEKSGREQLAAFYVCLELHHHLGIKITGNKKPTEVGLIKLLILYAFNCRRLAANSPPTAVMNNHAAAGIGTGDATAKVCSTVLRTNAL